MKEEIEIEPDDIDDPLSIKEEAEEEDVLEAFEGITVGKVFHNVESSMSTDCRLYLHDVGKIKVVQKKIPKLKTREGLPLRHQREIITCDFIDCSKTFTTKSSLYRHTKNVHKKEKSHQCSQCLEKFSQRSHLIMHIRIVHNKEKPHACSQCSEKFSRRDHLTKHIGIVHNKEKPHACPQQGCASMFALKLDLKRHMTKIHNFETPYRCVEQNCGQKFVRSRDLNNHLRSVHGAPKLICGFQNCAATFTFRDSLLKHKKKHPVDE